MLLYGDESEALTHPYLARAWARRGADLRVAAPGQAKKVAMMGSLDHVKRRLIVHTSRTRHSADFIAHLEQLDRLFGPQPGRVTRPVVLVEDNGPIHVSKIARAALDARKHWLTVEWLPKYSPELNDIEVVWHDLKARHLAHQTFTNVEALDRGIHAAAEALNRERNVDSLVNWRISAWQLFACLCCEARFGLIQMTGPVSWLVERPIRAVIATPAPHDPPHHLQRSAA